MAHLTTEQRLIIIGRLQTGQSQSVVARQFNVVRSTISRLWRRFQETGSVADRPRSGRPRVTTPANDRFIRLRHLRNRLASASSTVQSMSAARRISDQTVRNRLHDAGLWARRPYRGPVLTDRHRQNRLRGRTSIVNGPSGMTGDGFGLVMNHFLCSSDTIDGEEFTAESMSATPRTALMRLLHMVVEVY